MANHVVWAVEIVPTGEVTEGSRGVMERGYVRVGSEAIGVDNVPVYLEKRSCLPFFKELFFGTDLLSVEFLLPFVEALLATAAFGLAGLSRGFSCFFLSWCFGPV